MHTLLLRPARWPASLRALLLAGLAATGIAPVAGAEALIPYGKSRLDNGLTVIVHTDRKAPVVAVNKNKRVPAGCGGMFSCTLPLAGSN